MHNELYYDIFIIPTHISNYFPYSGMSTWRFATKVEVTTFARLCRTSIEPRRRSRFNGSAKTKRIKANKETFTSRNTMTPLVRKKTSFEERRVNDRGLKNAARMWHGRGQFHHYFMISFCASRFMRIFLAHKERRSCGVSNTWPANIKKNEDFSLI